MSAVKQAEEFVVARLKDYADPRLVDCARNWIAVVNDRFDVHQRDNSLAGSTLIASREMNLIELYVNFKNPACYLPLHELEIIQGLPVHEKRAQWVAAYDAISPMTPLTADTSPTFSILGLIGSKACERFGSFLDNLRVDVVDLATQAGLGKGKHGPS